MKIKAKINKKNKVKRCHPTLFPSFILTPISLHQSHSFHLSQPFSLSYRSILPTSLTYVMLFRHQRLLTLRTWCGYRYEMVWKWFTTTHYFSWNNRNTQLLRREVKCIATPFLIFKKVKINFIDLLLKQVKTVSLNKSNSTVFQEELLPLMLLYRKENSELDSYCRHNVSLSHLYISRQTTHPSFNRKTDNPHHVQEF
jgi:hypothetical protein